MTSDVAATIVILFPSFDVPKVVVAVVDIFNSLILFQVKHIYQDILYIWAFTVPSFCLLLNQLSDKASYMAE